MTYYLDTCYNGFIVLFYFCRGEVEYCQKQKFHIDIYLKNATSVSLKTNSVYLVSYRNLGNHKI